MSLSMLSSPSIEQAKKASAGVETEGEMCNQRPNRETMSIEEATISNTWEIRKTS